MSTDTSVPATVPAVPPVVPVVPVTEESEVNTGGGGTRPPGG